MINTVAFDYGGVLGCEADDWDGIFKNVLDVAGITYEEMLVIWNKYWPQLKIGKLTIEEYWRAVGKKNNVDWEKLRNIYNATITIDNEVLNIATLLKEKLKIIVLSNDSVDWMQAKISRFKLNEIFNKIYTSGDLGVMKPQREIFELVLKDLNIKPEELLFIDNQENNIEMANSLGFKTILFTGKENLKKELAGSLN